MCTRSSVSISSFPRKPVDRSSMYDLLEGTSCLGVWRLLKYCGGGLSDFGGLGGKLLPFNATCCKILSFGLETTRWLLLLSRSCEDLRVCDTFGAGSFEVVFGFPFLCFCSV